MILIIIQNYTSPFSIRYFINGGEESEEDETAGRVLEGFVLEACRGFPLVHYETTMLWVI